MLGYLALIVALLALYTADKALRLVRRLDQVTSDHVLTLAHNTHTPIVYKEGFEDLRCRSCAHGPSSHYAGSGRCYDCPIENCCTQYEGPPERG